MPSPFPGMDPYLEDPAFWPDFHASFIAYWRDMVGEFLPGQYDVRVDEYICITAAEGDGGTRAMEPDLAISKVQSANGTAHHQTAGQASATVALAEPVIVPNVLALTSVQRYLRILHRPGNRVVTILELLSPSNKDHRDRAAYLRKRAAILRESVHLVELDLLRAGMRLKMGGPLPAADYYAFVSRLENGEDCEVYPWTLRDRCPRIRIPLIAPDPDVTLDLQQLLDLTYDRGRYVRFINYKGEPPVPLAAEDRNWLRERLKSAT